MNIYYARSIRGEHTADDRVFNENIISVIKRFGHIPTLETRPIRRGNIATNNQYIYLRDIAWIDNSQAMIAEVTNPSLGVGYEIAYAVHVAQIPVLCIAQLDTKVSAMIRGVSDVFFYRDFDALIPRIQGFLTNIEVIA